MVLHNVISLIMNYDSSGPTHTLKTSYAGFTQTQTYNNASGSIWINLNYRAKYFEYFHFDGWEPPTYYEVQPSIQMHEANLMALNDFTIKW